MALPESVKQQAELLLFAFCTSRLAEATQGVYHLAFRIRQNTATIYECLGPARFSNRRPVAQLRYIPDSQVWVLYRVDDKHRWHLYENARPTADLTDLLITIHMDSSSVFFG